MKLRFKSIAQYDIDRTKEKKNRNNKFYLPLGIITNNIDQS